ATTDRDELVTVFKTAWHKADREGRLGERAEAGIDAVLAALAVPATGEVEWAVRHEYDGSITELSGEVHARSYAGDVTTVTSRDGSVTEHHRTLMSRNVGPW